MIKGKKIAEVNAEIGRHVDTYRDFDPKEIMIVDINPKAIEYA